MLFGIGYKKIANKLIHNILEDKLLSEKIYECKIIKSTLQITLSSSDSQILIEFANRIISQYCKQYQVIITQYCRHDKKKSFINVNFKKIEINEDYVTSSELYLGWERFQKAYKYGGISQKDKGHIYYTNVSLMSIFLMKKNFSPDAIQLSEKIKHEMGLADFVKLKEWIKNNI